MATDIAQAAAVDEFARHELMDRAHWLCQIIDTLEDHPAHTKATRAALEEAQSALGKLYTAAGEARFSI